MKKEYKLVFITKHTKKKIEHELALALNELVEKDEDIIEIHEKTKHKNTKK